MLAFCLGKRAPASLLAGELVEGSIQATRAEGFTGLDLLAALPPLGVGVRENILRGGLRGRLLVVFPDLIFKL